MQEAKYFNIENYLKNLELDPYILEHLAEVEERFDKYLKSVLELGKEEAMTYLTMETFNELLFSNQIEDQKILPPSDFLKNDLLASNNYLTNRKIHNIQKIMLQNASMPYPIGEYRQVPVFIKKDGQIVYYAPQASDVPSFMNDLIHFYNKNNDKLIHNDPFIKASLIHFLFIKIHPFVDGNGRVARILHNLKFTELVNKTYKNQSEELKLKLTPLNISYSIYRNKPSYYERLNNIAFYDGADINKSVNNWLEFLLYMYEEQLYYTQNSKSMQNLSRTLKKIKE